MEKKKFNPGEWIQDESPSPTPSSDTTYSIDDMARVEELLQKIEKHEVDITESYSDWRNIGFAFANAFGEKGLELFHRISKFYSDYNRAECDRQYQACLKSTGKGITLGTFFFQVSQARINLLPDDEEDTPAKPMVVLPIDIFSRLPAYLQSVISIAFSVEERDILLLGSLVTLSACLPNVYGIYDGRRVGANLYLFVSAPASAGKGHLNHCKHLALPIHRHLRDIARAKKHQYESSLAAFNSRGKNEDVEKPERPPESMLFIPANNSSTGMFQLLFDNQGRGLIFETEGDTLTQTFKTDYGNYSDGLRKAFHHEIISYYRRTDREYVDIENPNLSVVLSGTPSQVHSLIPSAENGLFSRFIFYCMNVQPVWKDVFAYHNDQGLEEYFRNLGNIFLNYYLRLSEANVRFRMTQGQKDKFHQFFIDNQERYLFLQGIDYIATIRRLGLITFRLAMVISCVRMMEHQSEQLPEIIICSEDDFDTVLMITRVLFEHSSEVFANLPAQVKPQARPNKRLAFFRALPPQFRRQDYLRIAHKLALHEKTAQRYVDKLIGQKVVVREARDEYRIIVNY